METPKTPPETAKTEQKQGLVVKAMGNSYVARGSMNDFGQFEVWKKLTVMQKVPTEWIKEREIGGKKFKYLDYAKAQRCLNFVFNFGVDVEIIDKKCYEYEQKTSKGNAKVYEAMVHCRFTCADGAKAIKRDIISTHKAFENTATARSDCFKGALSKAWTLLAYSFGIASNVRDRDFDNMVEAQERPAEKAPAAPRVSKSFEAPPAATFDTSPADNGAPTPAAPY